MKNYLRKVTYEDGAIKLSLSTECNNLAPNEEIVRPIYTLVFRLKYTGQEKYQEVGTKANHLWGLSTDKNFKSVLTDFVWMDEGTYVLQHPETNDEIMYRVPKRNFANLGYFEFERYDGTIEYRYMIIITDIDSFIPKPEQLL